MHASPTPARKVVTRSPARTVRLLHLPGLFKAPVECESSLERDFVYRASLCPGVADIRHQPFQLTLASRAPLHPRFPGHAFRWHQHGRRGQTRAEDRSL